MGVELRVHDPYVEQWSELEAQASYPSKARFFERQDGLAELRIEADLESALAGADAIAVAVRHAPYLDLDPDHVVATGGRRCLIVGCFCILDDARIRRYFELGCEVKGMGMGRGHVRRIKCEVRERRDR